MIQAPGFYDPVTNPEQALGRRNVVSTGCSSSA